MERYDYIVIGGGPAGIMGAIAAAANYKRVALFEKQASLGKKFLLTGNSRCNLTNAQLEISKEFLNHKYPRQGEFLRTVLTVFSVRDLQALFEAKGVTFIQEDLGRILPKVGGASRLLEILEGYLADAKVEVFAGQGVESFSFDKENGVARVHTKRQVFLAPKVLLSTGGIFYPETGSTGSGFTWAKNIGHQITALHPGLVSLSVQDVLSLKPLQGIALDDVVITVYCKSKKKKRFQGELIITHFGLSGPAVLDMSVELIPWIREQGPLTISLDLYPEFSKLELEKYLLQQFSRHKCGSLKKILKTLFQQRLAGFVSKSVGLPEGLCISQITRSQRLAVIDKIKDFKVVIEGAFSEKQAMVTSGGILTKEINPQTMESRLVPGLYFAGEIIDGCGLSGGYNLQQAFSTGYLAGQGR
jgi:predicted Rossmann fold flavoprotein